MIRFRTASFSLLVLLAASLLSSNLIARQNVPAARNVDTQSKDEADFRINNVRSTSMATPAAALQIPIDKTVAVRGIVLDVDGSPAENAEVWAASTFSAPPLRERVTTDAAGKFVLQLEPGHRWSLSAYLGSSGAKIDSDLKWIDSEKPQQKTPLVANLKAGYDMHCRVLTAESGEPIPEARLYLGDGRVFISDSGGQIKINGLKQGNHPMVMVARGKERRRLMFDNTLRPNGKLNIYLRPAEQLTGVVVDDNNRPIPHAWVDAPASGTAMALDGRCVIADSEGRFIWDGILPGLPYDLSAGKEGYTDVRLTNRGDSPAPDKEIVFRLTAKEAATDSPKKDSNSQPKLPVKLALRDIEGSIFGPDDEPVANAIVRWGATIYEEIEAEVRSDDKGQFKLAGVPARDGYLTVIADQLAPQFEKVSAKDDNVTISLYAGAEVQGQVLSESGDPVFKARIVPVIGSPDPSLCNPFWLTDRATRSDEAGNFKITGLPAMGTQFDFMHDDMTELRNQYLQVGPQVHKVTLGSRGGFRGRLIDSSGKPVRDFRVTLNFPHVSRPDDKDASGFSVTYMRYGNSYTDDEGRFIFGEEVNPGAPYRVTVTAPGYGQASIDRVMATTIHQLKDSKEYVFRLEPAHQLTIQTRDAQNGKPIENAKVWLIDRPYQANGYFSWGYQQYGVPARSTDQSGTVSIDDLALPEATIAVRASGYARQQFEWRNGENEFSVNLIPEASIGGSIHSANGEPVQGLFVSLESLDKQSCFVQLDRSTDGQFQINELPGGWYTITVNDERRDLYTKQILVKNGEHVKLTIKLRLQTGKLLSFKRTVDEARTIDLLDTVEPTVNGKNLSRLTFAEGLERFKAPA